MQKDDKSYGTISKEDYEKIVNDNLNDIRRLEEIKRGIADLYSATEAFDTGIALDEGEFNNKGIFNPAKQEIIILKELIRSRNELLKNINVFSDAEIMELQTSKKIVAGSHALIDYDGDLMQVYITGFMNCDENDEYGFYSVTMSSPVGKLLIGKTEGDVCDYVNELGINSKIAVVKIYNKEELEQNKKVRK